MVWGVGVGGGQLWGNQRNPRGQHYLGASHLSPRLGWGPENTYGPTMRVQHWSEQKDTLEVGTVQRQLSTREKGTVTQTQSTHPLWVPPPLSPKGAWLPPLLLPASRHALWNDP